MGIGTGEAFFISALLLLTSATVTYIFTRYLVKKLASKQYVVEDFHKPNKPKVPCPGGPAIVLGVCTGELILFLLTLDNRVLAILYVTLISGAIGFIDDFKTLGGVTKPLILILAALPILILPNIYGFRPVFPIFGPVRLPLIYPLLILVAISITANTFNTIDVLNGAVSGFTIIATFPLLLAFILNKDQTALFSVLPITATALAFYIFHRYPSRILPGDTGSLALGACYGALAIIGRAEVVGIVAILPAILNSFLFLSSVKKLVEHRAIKARPTVLLEDGRIAASKNRSAPITLIRMILAEGPLSEKEVVRMILLLAAFSAILAAFTALLTWGI